MTKGQETFDIYYDPEGDFLEIIFKDHPEKSYADQIEPGVIISKDEVTDEVFAIGSPLDEELQGTVSSGIVSSFREIEGEKYIQSDVTVHGGNSGGPLLNGDLKVIGLSVRGMQLMSTGTGVGLNFFIPIQDGFDALNISEKQNLV